ncbi:unnamed protein product [Ilex paraguariensis]|uniref:Uncharacterized protein n=1 Tax=Ilex paraguariensis TaxID=185542 RepID=A0ABC8SP21_9AQUA
MIDDTSASIEVDLSHLSIPSDIEQHFTIDDIPPSQWRESPCLSSNETSSDEDLFMLQPSDELVLMNQPHPLARVQILFDKYSQTLAVIALFDIGDAVCIINPSLLPGPH